MTTLLPRLREATAETHLALERRLGLGSRVLDARSYVEVLAGFHGFFGRESAVRRFPWPELHSVFADRWRLPLLADDLRRFDFPEPSTLPRCPQLPDLLTPGHVLGSCYVMEGSTLGGQVVSRRVEQSLGLTNGDGYSFFLGHGPAATGARWKQFVGWMDEQASAATDPIAFESAAVAGAVGTFAALDAWFAERLTHASPIGVAAC